MATIGTKLDEGWRVAYSDRDGTGRDDIDQTAAAMHSQNRRGEPELTIGLLLGPKAVVADAERAGIALAFETHLDTDIHMLLILTDNLAAKQVA